MFENHEGRLAQFSGMKLTSIFAFHPHMSLVSLDVSHNALQSPLEHLPRTIKTLNVSYNQLISLKGCKCCSNLESVIASNNMLHDISDLGFCLELKRLDCSHNTLTRFSGLEV